MEVNDTLIDKLCQLSRLAYSGEEREEIRMDLEKLLEFVGKINELDTTGIEPLIHITDSVNRFREDEAIQVITRAEALKNAPAKDSEYFHVPKMIEK